MLTYQSLEELSLHAAWLTIGFYDGVHRGHQQILQNMATTAHAAGAQAAVLTFFPHPSVVLRGRTGRIYLSSPEERLALLAAQGIDAVITLPFTRELAAISAQDFMESIKRKIDLRQLWVGFNFTLGRNREGNVETLRRMGETMGYSMEIIQPVTDAGETISSSLIRDRLAQGNVHRAAELLGRYYSVPGEVVTGDGRGRKLGIPTANLDIWPERILPAVGVYACWAWVGILKKRAIVNIGSRPTFESEPVPERLEAHILDLEQDLYGRNLRIDFVERLRGEKRFDSVDALVDQIHSDGQRAREILQA
jgi:riboflavin kinase/FMN adenylyltransferase